MVVINNFGMKKDDEKKDPTQMGYEHVLEQTIENDLGVWDVYRIYHEREGRKYYFAATLRNSYLKELDTAQTNGFTLREIRNEIEKLTKRVFEDLGK